MTSLAPSPVPGASQKMKGQFWLGALLLAAITFIAFAPAFHGGWLWDDDSMVTDNDVVQSGTLKQIWHGENLPDYFPLTWTSLWMEWKWFGMNPTGYHITNIFLHVISVILLWRLLVALKIPGAWLGAALWAVHPMNVESVAWIEERKNLLPQPFFFLSLLAYLRFDSAADHDTPREKRALYLLALASHGCALLAKTSIVMQPFVLLGLAWWRRNRITANDILRLVPFFLLSFSAGLATMWFQKHHAIGDDVVNVNDFLTRLGIAGRALWFYLGKAVVPLQPTFIYPKWEVDGHSFVAHLWWVLFLIVIGVAWTFRRGWGKPLLFTLGYFSITILPLLGFVNIYFQKYSYVEDHYQYVPLVSVCALIAGLSVHLIRSEKLWLIFCAVAVGLLAMQTFGYARAYRDIETLWADTLKKNPKAWVVYGDRGRKETDRGHDEAAVVQLRKGLEVHPQDADLHQSLGLALANLGRTDEAMEQYREALRLQPLHFETLNAIGALLLDQHQFAEAREYLLKALSRRPAEPNANNNMGYVLWQLGDTAQADLHFQQALFANPNFVLGHFNYAGFLVSLGEVSRAKSEYETVLRLDPKHQPAHLALGKILLEQGKTDEAETHFKAAAEEKNGSVEAEYQLGAIAYSSKQINEALTHWRKAIALDPKYFPALNNLGWIYATDPALHNGAEAVHYAEQAAKLFSKPNVSALDTLAAAYAEAGRFDEAIVVIQKAIEKAESDGMTAEIAKLKSRSARYSGGKPFREN